MASDIETVPDFNALSFPVGIRFGPNGTLDLPVLASDNRTSTLTLFDSECERSIWPERAQSKKTLLQSRIGRSSHFQREDMCPTDSSSPTNAANAGKCLPDFASVSEKKMSVYIKRLFTLAAKARSDGIIHAADLEVLLLQSGFNFPSSIVSRILQETVDTSGDCTVSLAEHVRAVNIIRQEAQQKVRLVSPKVLGRAAVFWTAGNKERKVREMMHTDCNALPSRNT